MNQTTDDFWTQDIKLFDGVFSYYHNQPRPVRGKIHTLDNLPRSQALLEDQFSRITWRDIIFLFRGTVSLVCFGSFFCPTPSFVGEAPDYLVDGISRLCSHLLQLHDKLTPRYEGK